MEATSADLLAYIALTGTAGIEAQSQAVLTKGDITTRDFQTGKYFEAEDFSFGIKLDDREPTKTNAKDGSLKDDGDTRSFARWRRISALDSARGNDKVDPPFRSQPDDVSFTRFIDSASPVLIENCLNSVVFSRLVLVKRARSGDETLVGMLRFNFTKVRIKSIEWDDGDAIKESCKFSFETVEVLYRKRDMSGTPTTDFRTNWQRQQAAGK